MDPNPSTRSYNIIDTSESRMMPALFREETKRGGPPRLHTRSSGVRHGAGGFCPSPRRCGPSRRRAPGCLRAASSGISRVRAVAASGAGGLAICHPSALCRGEVEGAAAACGYRRPRARQRGRGAPFAGSPSPAAADVAPNPPAAPSVLITAVVVGKPGSSFSPTPSLRLQDAHGGEAPWVARGRRRRSRRRRRW